MWRERIRSFVHNRQRVRLGLNIDRGERFLDGFPLSEYVDATWTGPGIFALYFLICLDAGSLKPIRVLFDRVVVPSLKQLRPALALAPEPKRLDCHAFAHRFTFGRLGGWA